jgi:two-component system phosphate regulon sensor histidine kinase PhoR
MRADFVANVSHELQTPLTTIIGFAETLQEEPPPPEDQARRFLALIHTEATRLSRLVDDLLALSRLEHHSLPVRREVVALEPLAADVVLQLSARAEAAGLDLSLEVVRPAYAYGDADLLREVLINLVSNAIQYTGAGGRIVVRVDGGPGAASLEVADTGIGIPSQDVPRIFERFYRVDRDRSRASGGTGLGLAIVKHIVESHRGSITVRSEPRVGSTFRVDLPPAPAPDDAG